MFSLAALNEAFITRANRSVVHDAPIKVAMRTLPVLPTDRWAQVKLPDGCGSLFKAFEFQNNELRDRFILGILEYENHTEHRAKVTFSDKRVMVSVVTKHIDIITELDKDYTKFCDTLYRDVVYSRLHGRPHEPEPYLDEP
jgi:pterin-4a-carbinolamine dehydratase